jgi:hypothetical protein
MVEALGSDRSDEPLGVGIGIRSPKRRAQHPSAVTGEDGVEARHVLCISVTEEELDLDSFVFKVAGDVSRLLSDPGRGRMGGDPRDPKPRRRPSSMKKSRSVVDSDTVPCRASRSGV